MSDIVKKYVSMTSDSFTTHSRVNNLARLSKFRDNLLHVYYHQNTEDVLVKVHSRFKVIVFSHKLG